MSADLYFTADSFVFLSSFFIFSLPISELAERNWTEVAHMLGSNCDLKAHVQLQNLGYPTPYKSGPKNHLFGRLRNLTATLMAHISGTKQQYRQSVKCVDNYKGSSTSSQNVHELCSTNSFKLDLHFYPPSVNSAFCFIARLRRRRSAKRTQPNFANRRMVNRANNLP